MFVSYGDEGAQVAYWQILLKYDLGIDLGAWGDGSYTGTPKDGVDGDFGDAVKNGVASATGGTGDAIGPMEARILHKKAFGGSGSSGGLSKADADKLYQPKGTIPGHGHSYAPKVHGHSGTVVEKTEVTLS